MIPPYDLASPNTPQDDFNFFHSSARITVECAFGEVDLRWGFFWKHLGYSVNKNMMICEAAMHLHNFLVTYRDDHDVDNNFEKTIFHNDCNDNGSTAEVIGNDNRRIPGRPSFEGEASKTDGLLICDKFKHLLMEHDMHRPRLANA